jgi:hypothetical protein
MHQDQVRAQAARCLQLFPSLDRGYALCTPNGTIRASDGKVEADYVNVKAAVTQRDWERHILGEKGRLLTLYPLLTDGTCFWGCIDWDFYKGGSVESIKDKIKQRQLGLMMFQSKSGGLHLFKSMSKPVPATKMRVFLNDARGTLGFPPDTEIFPKSTDPAEGFPGGAVNMPFFGEGRES